jgi:cyanophycin synthetase
MVGRVDEAFPAAPALAPSGDVVLVTYEKVEPVLSLLGWMGAVPVTEPMLSVATGRLVDVTQLVVT